MTLAFTDWSLFFVYCSSRVGFGVVEARSLNRRRQQIALDNVKLRTVDQKTLDTYKIRIFKEGDILYSDDEDEEDEDSDSAGAAVAVAGASGTGLFATGGRGREHVQEKSNETGGGPGTANEQQQEFNEKEEYDVSRASPVIMPFIHPQRVFARADLTALRLGAMDRGYYNNNNNSNSLVSPGRRSGSFDETVYGGLDASKSRRGSSATTGAAAVGHPFYPDSPMFLSSFHGPSATATTTVSSAAAALALSRDERCRSWAENKAGLYDYGGESESEYGYDQEQGYKSHAQEGWADLKPDKIESLDATREEEEEAAASEQVHSLTAAENVGINTEPVPAARRGSWPATNAPSGQQQQHEEVEGQVVSAPLPTVPGLHSQPTLRRKSRFILPRKIETALPGPTLAEDIAVISPTVFGEGSTASENTTRINSTAGPDAGSRAGARSGSGSVGAGGGGGGNSSIGGALSTGGLSTAGFLPPQGWGGDRRRSSLTTVVAPSESWIGPQGQRLRRSSLQVQRISGEDSSRRSSLGLEVDQDDEDDGRGVGHFSEASYGKRLRKSSLQVHRISLDHPTPSLSSPMTATTEVVSTPVGPMDSAKKQKDTTVVVTSPMQDYKMRFSMLGIDLPDIYSPTTGEFSRLSLDADRLMQQQSASQKGLMTRGGNSSGDDHHLEELQDDAHHFHRHGKDGTEDSVILLNEAGPSAAAGAGVKMATLTTAADKKPRRRQCDPCAICLEEYEVGDRLRELPCKHFFHSQCIDPWFKDVHGICPVCRRDYSEGKKTPPAPSKSGYSLAPDHLRRWTDPLLYFVICLVF